MGMGSERPAVRSASSSSEALINIAATCQATRALGPGTRGVIWVQGCPFHCPGCIAPDWVPMRPARLVSAGDLAEEILQDPQVRGLTISGGEPMLQAAGLSQLVRLVKHKRDVDVICFTGFRIEQLRKTPPGPGVEQFLREIDVLVDGPYIEKLNNNAGLRGSANQRILHLTDRLSALELEKTSRQVEIQLSDGQVMLVGIPPLGIREAFTRAMDQANAAWGAR